MVDFIVVRVMRTSRPFDELQLSRDWQQTVTAADFTCAVPFVIRWRMLGVFFRSNADGSCQVVYQAGKRWRMLGKAHERNLRECFCCVQFSGNLLMHYFTLFAGPWMKILIGSWSARF